MTIEQNRPYSMEFQNFRRVHRNRAVGELFAVELEITEEDWHYLSAFPQDAIGQVAIQWSDRAGAQEKPKREAKPAKLPTPYGAFWRELDKAGFHNRHDVRTWLGAHDLMEAQAKDRLRQAFSAQSRATDISPQSLREWLARMPDSDGAIAMIEKLAKQTAA